MNQRFATYAEFWPHYLREHAKPLTRRVHAVGTYIALALIVTALLAGPWWLLLAGVVAGYGFAWLSHLLVERNRPATFTHPLWSLVSDFRMAFLMAAEKLDPELARAGVPPAR
jgi:hypothetical protein